MVLAQGGDSIFVANRRSGSISVIDTGTLEVRGETHVAESLSDLVVLPGRGLAALDDRSHQLLRLEAHGSELRVTARISISSFPARMTASGDGRFVYVTSTWSRRLDIVEPHAGEPRVVSVDLPFAPRELLALEEARLVVADAFGGHLATVNTGRAEVERVVEIPAHHIRGLAREGDRLLLTYQRIEKNARTDREELVWGVFNTNALLSLDLPTLLTPRSDVLRGKRMLDLGGQVVPSGDPERVLLTESGEVVVSLGGVGRVALGRTSWPRLDHVKAGRRPVALAASPTGRVFVANMHSDSISVIDLESRKPLAEIALGPQTELDPTERGELLFYDATLSLRGWMSCHSCHTDGHTNGIVVDTQGDGGFGAPKRVPSLFGVAASGPWAWNGEMRTLSAQIEKSLRTTLHANPVTAERVGDLEAYLSTLEAPSLPETVDSGPARPGEALFRQKCSRCHAPPAYTSAGVYDVGLSDELGARRFNPPSLRGARYRDSFLHDGRARSLEGVLALHQHPSGRMTESEIAAIVAFLQSL
jgi:YVTN family beta-propeller protein